jgi:hypothetical protein
MGIAPHIARLRAFVGHELLLLPSVAVPAPADGELSEVAWLTREELRAVPVSRFARALLTETGYLSDAGLVRRRLSVGGGVLP